MKKLSSQLYIDSCQFIHIMYLYTVVIGNT